MSDAKEKTVTITLGRLLNSKEQWGKLASIKKAPRIAFKIAKFIKRVIEENLQLIEEQRNEYIKEFSTAAEGETPSIDAKKHKDVLEAFMKKFNEYLETEITVDKVDVKMEDLIEAMESNKGTVVDELVLMEIEDFFLSDEEEPASKRRAKKPAKRKPAKAA